MLKQTSIAACFLISISSFAYADALPAYATASSRLVVRGQESLVSKDLFGALTTFEKALVANPNNVKAYLGLGQAHLALGNIDLALKYLDTGLLMDPSNLSLLKEKGVTLIRLGDDGASKAVLDKIRFICEDKACPQGDELEAALTKALQKKVAEIKPK